MPLYVNINGKMVPADEPIVHANSRAFRYGYGLFETMLVQDGKIRLEKYHWERLKDGMNTLSIGAPSHFFSELKDAVLKTLQKNKHEKLGRIRLEVWPSSGGLYDGDAFSARYCIETFSLDEKVLDLNTNGLVVGIAQGVQKNPDAISHIKSSSALPYAVAARQAKEQLWNDALLLNHQGNIVESTIANIFWVSGNQLFTAPLSEGCIAGVMRRHLLAILPQMGYEILEVPAVPETLRKAESVFLTNSIRTLRWVGGLNGHGFHCGTCLSLHQKLLRSF